TGGSLSASKIYTMFGFQFPEDKVKIDPTKLSYQDIKFTKYNDILTIPGGNYSISDEGGDDTIILNGFSKEDISFQKIARDLSIRYGNDNYLMIRNQDNPTNRVETIKLMQNEEVTGYITSSQIDKIIEQLNTYANDNGLTTITHDDISSNQNLMQIVMSGWN
nr:hypothetical protein [Campylobacter sp.]